MEQEKQLAKLGLFDAKVPRYTSYPTAPHFNNDVTPDTYKAWIEAIPTGSQVSLYVHVPFCHRLCWFCACRTQGTSTLSPVATYVETLKDELKILRASLPEGVTLSRLHWGGGTPTLLDASMMEDLAGAIFDVTPMAKDGEFSVEIDPNEIDHTRLEALAKAGMNRASIGVQDFDDEIQKTIGRIQGYDITRDAVEMIRAHGVKSVNADILSVAQRNGTLRRNFQGYTDDTADVLLAVGASSIARFPQGYAQNAPATSAHTGAIRDRRFSTSRGHTFTDDDRLRGRVIEALMCDFRIDAEEIVDRFDISRAALNEMFSKVMAQFPDVLALESGALVVPLEARPLTRIIARAFDAYDMSKAQHSAAI